MEATHKTKQSACLLGALTLAFMSLLLLSSSAISHSTDSFGALAFSHQTQRYGWSVNHHDLWAAKRQALHYCGYSCEIVVQFRNTCASYASTPNGTFGWGIGYNKSIADSNALYHCNRYDRSGKCEIKVWGCSN